MIYSSAGTCGLQQWHHKIGPVTQLLGPRPLPGRRLTLAAAEASTSFSEPDPAPAPPAPKIGPSSVPATDKPSQLGGRILYDYQTGFESQFYEYDYYIEEAWIDGKLPEDIRGTFFSICPGMTQVFGTQVRNAADGDGMVASFSFAEGNKIFFRNRFVRTPSFQAEQVAGRRLSRGLHDKGAADGSWLFNPLDLNVRSPANSAVLCWDNHLYALSDHALPHELNKTSLDTVGESDIGGLFADTKTMAGKYHVLQTASGEQRVVLMSAPQSGPDAAVRFVELDAAGKVVAQASHRVGGCIARMVTDFLVTENYYVLLQSPLSFNVPRFMSRYVVGEVSFAECIDFEGEQPSRIHLIPRQQPGEPKQKRVAMVLDAPPMASFTTVNAFELGGGSFVVADIIAQEGTHFYKDMTEMVAGYYRGQPKPELTRLIIDVAQRTVKAQTLSHRSMEGGIVAPGRVGRPHRHVYASAAANEDASNWGPSQVITKLNIHPSSGMPFPGISTSRLNRASSSSAEVWAPGPRDFLGPLTFVPKANAQYEDDGWILTMLHNAETQKAELIILDASRLSAGPVCSILLPHHMPHATGGQWVSKYLGPARGAPASWRPKQVRSG